MNIPNWNQRLNQTDTTRREKIRMTMTEFEMTNLGLNVNGRIATEEPPEPNERTIQEKKRHEDVETKMTHHRQNCQHYFTVEKRQNCTPKHFADQKAQDDCISCGNPRSDPKLLSYCNVHKVHIRMRRAPSEHYFRRRDSSVATCTT